MTRFSGTIGKEYAAFKEACPHHDRFQQAAGRELAARTFSGLPRLLEIGFGTGETTQTILAAHPTAHVVSIDYEELMLGQPEIVELARTNHPRLQFKQADALAFLRSQPESAFDAVVSGFTFHNWEQGYRKEALAQVLRVLKTNGLFINADKYAHDDADTHSRALNWQMGMILAVFPSIGMPELVVPWLSHYLEDDKPERRMVEGTSIRLMEELGFADMRIVFREQMEAVLVAEKV